MGNCGRLFDICVLLSGKADPHFQVSSLRKARAFPGGSLLELRQYSALVAVHPDLEARTGSLVVSASPDEVFTWQRLT
jgi:hypothetical protein